ncbi:Amino acid permease 2 [Olea europaea subsp. europaea]|uniref:Amino acid permease 2 n=1 Tax=Olea europaea subsp. europaea TaxID=158383 RepID=A0A8S0UM32_OLEEU|nr:Amino acid permease 2 [Olea europaea subsp. europaea]
MYLNGNCVDCKFSHINSSDWFWSSILALGHCSTGMVGWSISDDLVRSFDSTQIAFCYRSGDPNTGTRNYSFMDVVKANLDMQRIWQILIQKNASIGTIFLESCNIGRLLDGARRSALTHSSNWIHP